MSGSLGAASEAPNGLNPETVAITDELLTYKWALQVFGAPEKPMSEALEANAFEFSRYKLKRKYGKASQYLCYDCRNPAKVWSYCMTDIAEFNKDGRRFSLSPEKYVPRCGICQYNFLALEGGKGVLPDDKCEHVAHVPNKFVNNYEFKFCRKCGTYRRFPRKNYYAQHTFPSLSVSSEEFAKL